MAKIREKGEGFPKEKLYVIPRSMLDVFNANPALRVFVITDAGYFPHARYHLRQRLHGCEQNKFSSTVRKGRAVSIDGGDPPCSGAGHTLRENGPLWGEQGPPMVDLLVPFYRRLFSNLCPPCPRFSGFPNLSDVSIGHTGFVCTSVHPAFQGVYPPIPACSEQCRRPDSLAHL